MNTDDLFGKLKDAFGGFKMPENPTQAIDEANEIWKEEGDVTSKLSKLKDKFFTKEDSSSEETE